MSLSILFSVRGGPTLGMGHILRSLTLAECFRKVGCEIFGFVGNPDTLSQTLIEKAGYRFWCDSDLTSGASQHLASLACETQPHVLILDRPDDIRDTCRLMRTLRPSMGLTALDSLYSDIPELDVLISLVNHQPDMPHMPDHLDYYEGPAYGIIRERFRPWISMPRHMNPAVSQALVTFGGSDPNHHTLAAIDLFDVIADAGLTVHVVIGLNYAHRADIYRRLNQTHFPYEIHDAPSSLEELMFRCDVALCSGGTTMLELAAVGTPSVILPQSVEENHLAQYLADKHVSLNAGIDARNKTTLLQKAVERLRHDFPLRQQMSQTAKSVVDGRGAERICTLIVKRFTKVAYA